MIVIDRIKKYQSMLEACKKAAQFDVGGDTRERLRAAEQHFASLLQLELDAEPPAHLPYSELAEFMEEEARSFELIGGAYRPPPVSRTARQRQVANVLRMLADSPSETAKELEAMADKGARPREPGDGPRMLISKEQQQLLRRAAAQLSVRPEIVDELKRALDELRDVRKQLDVVKTDREGVWKWQGEGDDVSTLSCPVVMEAATLRALLEDAKPKKPAEDSDRQCFLCGSTAQSCVCSETPDEIPDDAIELDNRVRRILGVQRGQTIYEVAERIVRDASEGPVLDAARIIVGAGAPWRRMRAAAEAGERRR